MTPTDGIAQSIRADLERFTTKQIVAGMEAFSHPPRLVFDRLDGDSCGCWLTAAYGGDHEKAYQLVVSFGCSSGYEAFTDWFHGECLRVLAERGVAVEPSVLIEQETL